VKLRAILGLVVMSVSILTASTIINFNATNEGNSPVGEWRINGNGAHQTLSIAQQGSRYTGHLLTDDSECTRKLDYLTWNPETREIEFRRGGTGWTQWYRGTIADGVLTGRFSHAPIDNGPKPADWLAYKFHVTGFNLDAFDRVTPVAFDIIANGFRARLRIDRTLAGDFVGRMKYYAWENQLNEFPEEEITVTHWNGADLEFTRSSQTYIGTVDGASISGQFFHESLPYGWSGKRAEVLTYGLTPKSPEWRAAWQERTRRTLHRIMMAGNPAPSATTVEVLQDNVAPFTADLFPGRDDDPGQHPQNYTLTELRWTHRVPTWTGVPATRIAHGWLAKPTGPPPAGLDRYPLVVAINGHDGSAHQVMDPGTLFWYGDSWARRGVMVLAVDISHRPPADRISFGSPAEPARYLGYGGGYEGTHPSIKPPKPAGYTDQEWAYYTDFEEDGERAWDVMRAIDWALTRPDVDPARIVMTGLSLGGQIATYVGALDPRVAVTIPVGYSPDLSVLQFLRAYWQSDHSCWNWAWSDIRQYIDASDVFALIAPRSLIVETGRLDTTYSLFPQAIGWLPGVGIGEGTFAADKQVMRRTRAAYDDPARVLHFLHDGPHVYRMGELVLPIAIEPASPADLSWQTNGQTAGTGLTVFDHVRAFLNY
jgi:dienelactone hydrolase